MTIQNREAFLDNIAANLGRDRRTSGVKRPEWSLRPQDEVLNNLSADDLVKVLELQCSAIHTSFKRTTLSDLGSALTDTVKEYNGKSIVAGSDQRLYSFGLDTLFSRLEKEGAEIHLWDQELGEQNKTFAERADIGICFSDVTLAESATVTLFIDQANGRSISLLPESFIAIIPKSTLVPRLTQATRRIHEAVERGEVTPSCVSFISGPSNSADIEMKLIVGVHGPIRATYILVEDC